MKRRYSELDGSNDNKYSNKRRKTDNNKELQNMLNELTKQILILNNTIKELKERVTKLEAEVNPPKFTSPPTYFY